MKANNICPKVSVDIKGVNFQANLVVLELMDIDVILGKGWLSTCKGVIKYAQCLVLLTTPLGERIKYEGIIPAPEEYENDILEGVYREDNKVDSEFLDVNVEEQTPLEEFNVRDSHAYVDQPTRILE